MSSYTKEIKEPFAQGVSWSAVLVGVFITMATSAILSTLTSSCTSTAMSPLLGLESSFLVNLMSSTWMLLNFTVAFALGAFFTGKIASKKSAIHGFLMWSIAILILMGLLGSGLKTQNPVYAEYVSPTSGFVHPLNTHANLPSDLGRLSQPPSYTRLRTELELIVRPDEALNRTNEPAMERAKHKSKRSSLNPEQIRDAFLNWCEKAIVSQHPTLKEQDRNALRNLLRTETEYSDQEITTLIERINQIYEEEFAEMKINQETVHNEMKSLSTQVHQQAYKSCWSAFLLMLFTAISSVMASWYATHPSTMTKEKIRLGTE